MGGGRPHDLDERLARAARSTPHAVVLCDAQGRIDWVNDGFTRMTGYALEEARGRRPGDLLQCEETDPEALTAMSARLQAREGFRGELLNQAKDGRRFWVDLDIQPTFDAQGGLDGFMAIQAEVTSSRELQSRLNATTKSLRQASVLARLGGWEVDLREGVIRWSPELRERLGRPPVETIEESLRVFDVSERGWIDEYFIECSRAGRRVDFEAPGTDGQGRPIWLRVMGEPEMVDGRCVALHGATQDITAQREATAGLRQSERFARGVIDGFAARLAVVDGNGQIVAANASFRRRGAEVEGDDYRPEGQNLFEVIRRLKRSHARALERGIRDVLSGRVETLSRVYVNSSGEWQRATASRFAGDGPVRCVVVTQSIEDLKRSERRLRELNANLRRARDAANAANDAKSAFLATMSHEIRTPLNGVLGMAQAMARDELPARQRERLGVIRQAGETLLALLNDLLDLSRIESGRLELEDGLIDVGQLMAGAQATFTTLASEKDVSLELRVAPEAAGVWRGDPTRVRQILYNLVSNAVKFTARGAVRAEVGHQGGRLVLKVADTGPGIARERIPSLFQKFVQADASTTRRYGGTGLGLAICRELTSLMGGEISVDSVEGEGSTFTVRLPLKRAERARVDDPPVGAAPQVDLGPLRVLAAEDNPMNQLVLKTLLAQVGLDVRCVADGQEAVEVSAQEPWDVILMDVQMPRMDGPTAARLIRERERAHGAARTPIIALTANAMSHHRAEYLGAGMDVLVPKPVELERLLDAIQSLIEAAAA